MGMMPKGKKAAGQAGEKPEGQKKKRPVEWPAGLPKPPKSMLSRGSFVRARRRDLIHSMRENKIMRRERGAESSE